MKQINTSEANAIVGGTIPKTCNATFKTVGKDCFQVITCVDKNGTTVSEKNELIAGFHCGLENESGS
ncbi:TPA: DUF4762 family protein [Serratia fonticola]